MNDPTVRGGQAPPGYGGLVHDFLHHGHVVAMDVRPKK